MRCLVFLSVLITGLMAASPAWANCPFCPPASPTLSERLAQSDAVALTRWVKSTPANLDNNTKGDTTLEVVSVLKNFLEILNPKTTIIIPEPLSGQAGDLFLIFGTAETRDSTGLTWETPQPISEIGFHYLKQAPAPETASEIRLKYFLKFLEYSDPILATDAYYEFSKAEYADLVLIKQSFKNDRLRKWLDDPKTLAPRLGLYGLMLGLCGDASDAELLKQKILDDADKTRLGIDGIIGGYLLLTGERGLELLERTKLKDPKAPLADVHATMTAFRFLWQYDQGTIEKPRLRAAVRLLLDRQEVADLAIADLARWKDWSVQDRLMELYQAGDPGNPLGEIAIRHAVIRYMIASTLDQKPKADSAPHVVKGYQLLEKLKKDDETSVLRFERMMRPRER